LPDIDLLAELNQHDFGLPVASTKPLIRKIAKSKVQTLEASSVHNTDQELIETKGKRRKYKNGDRMTLPDETELDRSGERTKKRRRKLRRPSSDLVSQPPSVT
jgi:hypothetical protein